MTKQVQHFWLLLASILTSSIAFSQPSNDDPCNAIPLTVNSSCTYSTYTNASATASSGVPAPGCANYSGGDVWFTVTVPAGGQITVDGIQGVVTDGGMAIYSGSCGSLSLVACNDDSSPNGLMPMITLTGQTPGATLWIRFWEYGNNNNGTFGICATQPAGPPPNDDCSGAIGLTVNPDLNCGTVTAGTIESATGSSQSTAACGGTEDDDVWFSFTATGTTHTIDLLNITSGTTDLYHSVWSGNCPALGLVAGSCSDPNSSTVTGLTPGNTYYVRVYSWTSTAGQTSDFDICIGTPPAPPANDECSGAYPVTVNPDFSCTSVTSGTIASATGSTQSTAACGGTEDDDVWFSFTATGTTHTIDLLNITNGTTDLYHSVWSGNCPALSLVTGSCSDPNSSTVTGLTPGNTYYIRVYSWTSTTGQTSNFDVCVGTPPPPPANDDCSGAFPVTVNPDNLCGSTTSGTIASATGSTQSTAACGGTEDDDVWFSFTATGTTHMIDLLNITGGTSDLYHSVWSGNCPALSLVAGSCSDPNSSVVSGLTPGNTYYIRVYSWTSTTGQTSSFDVCVGTPPPPPANDDCANATTVPVSTTTCNYVTGSIYSATTSSQTNDCGGTADDDVWYQFTATSPAAQISLTNITGSTSDLYHSVYAGSCGSPGAAIICSDPNSSSVTGLTPGNTYFIRIFSWTGTAGQTSTFDLCVMETGACGTPETQDFCVAPAVLTAGAGSFSSNTSGTYTSDTPANLNTVFCGSIENNSWYEFVAASTSEVFNFTSVTGCTSGIQAEVYEVTEDVNGCCTNFTSMSNCWNPATATSGTVTATGLTPGNTYVLMVDGFGGDVCDFTVSNWTASGILPVTLVNFNAQAAFDHNLINWTTKSEIENDHFNVMRSFDGVNFQKIDEVEGAGNSSSELHYQVVDRDIRPGIVYYQLVQVDINGDTKSSEIISLNREEQDDMLQFWPNPTNSNLYVNLQPSTHPTSEKLEILDVNGKVIKRIYVDRNEDHDITIPVTDINEGVYMIRFVDETGVVTIKKFIKS
ncbi:MAG: T9SS type A sorting domain-containing protein [Crocinitomicaceae bacterium]|nr:T9SS type A sorting domain-containing protein [Crocinitomicaceae bacterium]